MGHSLCGRLGLDLLLLTRMMLQGTKAEWRQLPQGCSQVLLAEGRLLRLFLARFGSDKSMTVSLEEMLEDEDMLSRWLSGSSLLHSWSFMVASVQTCGIADWVWPAEATEA